MQVHAILLAAGSSRRFGADKLRAPYRGRPLFEHALKALTSCPRIAGTVVVVSPGFSLSPSPPAGPPGGPADSAPAMTELPPRCTMVVNPGHEEGMGSSLRAGVAATPADAEAFLFALADMPAVTPRLVAAMVDFAGSSPAAAVVPTFEGRRGHPVLIKASLRKRLLEVRGDVGTRGILAQHPDQVALFETGDPAVVFDVDTPADLGGAR
jgi:molybdenum cofactor cytidylyltransferase